MKKKPNIFIHIGAYKTGTTFLQERIFPFWPNIIYINDLWLSYIVLLEKDKKYIISNETLFGRPWARNNKLTWADERQLIIKALSRLFPDAQILVSFRKHSHFILSLYKQYLHEGGVRKLEEFYDFFEDRGVVRKDDIDYMATIKLLEECFELKPFVFTLEEIRDNLYGLLQRFQKLFGEKAPTVEPFAGKVPNPGVKYWQGKLLRILNIIDRRSELFRKYGGPLRLTRNSTLKYRIDPRSLCQERLRGLSKRPISFDKPSEDLVNSYYAEDWRRTKEFISTHSA